MTHERRVFVDLSQSDLHHLKRVARLNDGATVIAVDKSSGSEFEAAISGDKIEILRERPRKPIKEVQITICFAICQGKTNDFICEKATELGVKKILFWGAERSQFKEISENKLSRLKTIAENAAKQSARYDIPEINFTSKIEGLINIQGTKICCSLSERSKKLSDLTPFSDSIVIVIGPEGDFSSKEESMLIDSGFKQITLGYTRLKSETAALSAIISVNALASLRN